MERGVGYGFDSADRITFEIYDDSDMGSSNFFFGSFNYGKLLVFLLEKSFE